MPDQQRTKKRLVESCLHLGLRELKQAGLLDGLTRTGTFSWATQPQPVEARFMLIAHQAGMFLGLNDGLVTQRFALEPHYLYRRGIVWKIRCPLCGRRGEKLYMPLKGFLFACRCCNRLTYRSSQIHNTRMDWLDKNFYKLLNSRDIHELMPFSKYQQTVKDMLAGH